MIALIDSLVSFSLASPKSSTNTVVDLTDDDNKPVADSREMTINRYPGRIYPSLVVVARPQIKVKEMSSSTITAERTQLGTKCTILELVV